jgi:ATP-dependent helicase YprA (DUF1998 family)
MNPKEHLELRETLFDLSKKPDELIGEESGPWLRNGDYIELQDDTKKLKINENGLVTNSHSRCVLKVDVDAFNKIAELQEKDPKDGLILSASDKKSADEDSKTGEKLNRLLKFNGPATKTPTANGFVLNYPMEDSNGLITGLVCTYHTAGSGGGPFETAFAEKKELEAFVNNRLANLHQIEFYPALKLGTYDEVQLRESNKKKVKEDKLLFLTSDPVRQARPTVGDGESVKSRAKSTSHLI